MFDTFAKHFHVKVEPKGTGGSVEQFGHSIGEDVLDLVYKHSISSSIFKDYEKMLIGCLFPRGRIYVTEWMKIHGGNSYSAQTFYDVIDTIGTEKVNKLSKMC